MKRLIALAQLCLLLVTSCSPAVTPTQVGPPTLAPLQTAAPIVATPPPGMTLALHDYMQAVYERVLPEYARRVSANRDLLTGASSRSFDADMLCPGAENASWQQFGDLELEVSVIAVPPLAEHFHTALIEALAVANESAASYEWFCTTYTSFGQPAEGMWTRLSRQVRACESRNDDLHARWAAMGGDTLGLVW